MVYHIVLKDSLFPVTPSIPLFSAACFIFSASSPPSFPFFIYFIPPTFKDMLHSFNKYFWMPTMCQTLGCCEDSWEWNKDLSLWVSLLTRSTYWMINHFHFPAQNLPHICSNLTLLSRPFVQVFFYRLEIFVDTPVLNPFPGFYVFLFLILLSYFAEEHPLVVSWERMHPRQISKDF